ncbi:hypothetical protein M885DRAFT_551542 [Pelagophyceae sp. CCMP2097]|nr:hypothetical protein M885DRAFT_551542 [Pelagophyceae sp. CCMP2097]
MLRVRRAPSAERLLPSPLDSCDGEGGVDRSLRVSRAGDARANGIYVRCGKQNGAARWRHSEREWLCILRDGASWWIGNERAAREDLYWRSATLGGDGWRVCWCDDRGHRHFRGSAPVPELSWMDDSFEDDAQSPQSAGVAKAHAAKFNSDECPVCLCDIKEDAVQAPCGHVACGGCLARCGVANDAFPEGCSKCPLCRAPFALAGCTHLASGRPALEACPGLVRNAEKERPPAPGPPNPSSSSGDRPPARRPTVDGAGPRRGRRSLSARLAGLFTI